MLDHGVLNLPLSKRGNTLLGFTRAQVAAEAAAQKRLLADQRKTDKARAKELLAAHQDAIVARHGEKFGSKALLDTLDQWAKWEPAKLVGFVNKFLAEQAARVAA